MKEAITLTLDDFRIDPSRPLYEQLVEQIRSRIANGRIPIGSRLPSVRELAAAVRVNPTTAARTYQELERSGLIVTYRGQGTFVTQDQESIRLARKELAIAAVHKLNEIAESIGLTMVELIALAQQED